ncbi:MAG: hypothetical protein ACLT4C_00895 [Butyricicoccus sp.]
MNIILDDIDMVPDWYADFFIAKTGSTKWERVGGRRGRQRHLRSV